MAHGHMHKHINAPIHIYTYNDNDDNDHDLYFTTSIMRHRKDYRCCIVNRFIFNTWFNIDPFPETIYDIEKYVKYLVTILP